jgi:glycosyltransferase involved in cell wall biosynthesis
MLDPWFKTRYPLKHLKELLYWPWAEYRVLRDAAAVLFTCEEERILAKKSFSLYKANERVVNFGTAQPVGDHEAQKEQFYARIPELRDAPFLLYLSRIHPKKGIDILIEAFASSCAEQKELKLVVAGPDQVHWLGELKRQAEALGVADRIIWPGMLTGDVKWGAFYACEAFVLPSHQENFGIVVAEAMACARPVLISNKVNIWREIVEHGAGLVGPDTVEGTGEVLKAWMKLPKEERIATGIRAQKCFQSNFEITRAADSLFDVLEEVRDLKPVG